MKKFFVGCRDRLKLTKDLSERVVFLLCLGIFFIGNEVAAQSCENVCEEPKQECKEKAIVDLLGCLDSCEAIGVPPNGKIVQGETCDQTCAIEWLEDVNGCLFAYDLCVHHCTPDPDDDSTPSREKDTPTYTCDHTEWYDQHSEGPDPAWCEQCADPNKHPVPYEICCGNPNNADPSCAEVSQDNISIQSRL